jgi:hypothetical protein
MNFLLHRDLCSAFLRSDPRVGGRFIQNVGGLYVSTITVLDLEIWERKVKTL